MSNYAVIVDPVASGRFLTDEFAARGLGCIAILSQPIPAKFQESFSPAKFQEVLIYDGNFETLKSRLSAIDPVCVAAGLETGLELADRLAGHFGLPGNEPATTAARRDKYRMHEQLRARGVRSIKQCRAADAQTAMEWLLNPHQWPIVVKPTVSAGSDDVHLCQSIDETMSCLEQILGSRNVLGGVNHHVLLQEYLRGQEWVVDTVSCDGRHVVTNICRYRKIMTDRSRSIFQYTEYLSPAGEGLDELKAYALQVNDALGIRYGAAHHEIMATDKGPTLIEVNTRMHGLDATDMLRLCCYPHSQIDLTVDALVAPEAFALKSRRPFLYSTHMIAHFLMSKTDGVITFVAPESELKAIPSYRRGHLPKLSQQIKKTVSLVSIPGFIWLANENADALWRDHQLLRDMEERGQLYRASAA